MLEFMLNLGGAVVIGLTLGSVLCNLAWSFDEKYGYKEDDEIEY